MTSNSAQGSYVYPAVGQPHPHAVSQAGGRTYTYDANGNMLGDGTITVVYDGENRLVGDSTGAWSYVYGPDGSRLKKTFGNVTTLYNGDDWEVAGGTSTFYLPGDAVMTGGITAWNVRDQINSLRLSTNGAGAVVQRASYKPYGERLESIATLMTSKGFTGKRNDETGLVYLHARYLYPTLGTFITPDPSPDPTAPGVGLNRYAYAGNDPISSLDPSRLEKYTIGLSLTGYAGTGGGLHIGLSYDTDTGVVGKYTSQEAGIGLGGSIGPEFGVEDSGPLQNHAAVNVNVGAGPGLKLEVGRIVNGHWVADPSLAGTLGIGKPTMEKVHAPKLKIKDGLEVEANVSLEVTEESEVKSLTGAVHALRNAYNDVAKITGNVVKATASAVSEFSMSGSGSSPPTGGRDMWDKTLKDYLNDQLHMNSQKSTTGAPELQ